MTTVATDHQVIVRRWDGVVIFASKHWNLRYGRQTKGIPLLQGDITSKGVGKLRSEKNHEKSSLRECSKSVLFEKDKIRRPIFIRLN